MMPATSERRVRAIFALIVCAVLVWEVRVLFWPVVTVRAAGAERYDIMEFSAGAPVGQTFRALTDGLDTAIVEFSADRPAALVVQYRLMGWAPAKMDDHWAAVIEGTETVSLSAGRNRHAFRFKGIADSNRQVYQFQVQQVEARAADGSGAPVTIAVVGSTDGTLDDGNLIVARDQIVDRDLVFQARGADSRFDDFRMRVTPQLPRALRPAAVQWTAALLLLALYNWAVAVFAYHLLRDDSHDVI